MDLTSLIRNVPDFPRPGIQFKDVTTLLLEPKAFHHIVDVWKKRYHNKHLTAIVAADARGFIFGAALAYAMELPLVLVRKKGKLPSNTISEDYFLEYGSATLEIHVDALKRGDKVVLIDDLLATGGTMEAMIKLVDKLGAHIHEVSFVVELPPLNGREKLQPHPVHSLVEFMVDEE